jgi:2-polyprenyl-3-methyl-5-hydroxy-6-metoxy-1,4-benzoquinol methylase
MKSPITGSTNVSVVKKYSVEYILKTYNSILGIDVSRFFIDVDEVVLYRCLDTSYEFYTPISSIYGDSAFYQELEQYPWYYLAWKPEFELASREIKKYDSVLEIGSGGLDFITHLSSRNIDVVGLELNKKSVELGEKRDINVLPETVEQHSSNLTVKYDFICSFQVLEHISNISSFINSTISLLNPNGRFFVSVPNNDSFIKYDKNYALNMPPHHAGKWTEKSLRALTNYYPLRLIDIKYETLQEVHYDWYSRILASKNILSHFRYFNSAFIKHYKSKARTKYTNIKGHTISALYELV